MSNKLETVIKTDKKPKPGKGGIILPPGPGRPKGTKNKFTDLKQAYLDVFDKIEKKSLEKESAIKSFFQWATKNDRNQGMFYQMVAKMLPTNLTGDLLPDVDGKLTITIIRTKSKDEDNGK